MSEFLDKVLCSYGNALDPKISLQWFMQVGFWFVSLCVTVSDTEGLVWFGLETHQNHLPLGVWERDKQ